jgi:hypothetical protein
LLFHTYVQCTLNNFIPSSRFPFSSLALFHSVWWVALCCLHRCMCGVLSSSSPLLFSFPLTLFHLFFFNEAWPIFLQSSVNIYIYSANVYVLGTMLNASKDFFSCAVEIKTVNSIRVEFIELKSLNLL